MFSHFVCVVLILFHIQWVLSKNEYVCVYISVCLSVCIVIYTVAVNDGSMVVDRGVTMRVSCIERFTGSSKWK